MEASSNLGLFKRLGEAIDNSLAAWESYLDTLAEQSTYESIVSNDTKDTFTKVKAIQHILETLQSRYTTLTKSYCDTELEFAALPDICFNLLEELQNPASSLDLSDYKITGKRFVGAIARIEKEVSDQEQGRLQELRRLKAVHMSFMAVHAESPLDLGDVEEMLKAMEMLGVSLAGTEVIKRTTDVPNDESMGGVVNGT